MNEWMYLLAFSLLLWPRFGIFSTSALPKHQLIFHGGPGAFSDVGQFCAIPISQKRKLLPFSVFHSRRMLLRAQRRACPVWLPRGAESFQLRSLEQHACLPQSWGWTETLPPTRRQLLLPQAWDSDGGPAAPGEDVWAGSLSVQKGLPPSPATSGAGVPDPWRAGWPCARPLGPLCGQPGLRALIYVDGW